MLKTFYRIFTIADYEEEEAWLREQHKSGCRDDDKDVCSLAFHQMLPSPAKGLTPFMTC